MPAAKVLFEALVREHADMLWGFLRSIVRDAAAAEDLFQETLFTAWKTLDRYDASLPFGPWLRGIAGKLILARRRKLATHLLLTVDEASLEAIGTLYAQVATRPGDVWLDKLDLLRKCLAELPEMQREVIELYYWQDLDCQSMAEKLTRPLEAIKKRLQRARAALAECVQVRFTTLQGTST